jgi:osomolarity two-component system sensor histidine kinase SLN1
MPNPSVSLLPEPVVQNRASSTSWKGIQAALNVQWTRIKRLVNSQPTTSVRNADIVYEKEAGHSNSPPAQQVDEIKEETEVDEVVVDRVWSEDLKSSVTQYDSDQSEKSEGNLHGSARASLRLSTDQLSTRALHVRSERFKGCGSPLVGVMSRFWLGFKKTFFSLRFSDPKTEATYLEENWSLNKVRHSSL